MPYTRAKVNSYFLETTLRVTSSFCNFFACPSRASQKSGLEVRGPALRERDNKNLATKAPPPGAVPRNQATLLVNCFGPDAPALPCDA